MTILSVELEPKLFELLHELVPAATVIALLVNPTSPFAETLSRDAQAAARTLGLQLHVLQASTEREFDTVFANLVQLRVGALVIGPDVLFTNGSDKLAALMLRHALPAIYPVREFAAAGGLMSYGPSIAEAWRLMGVYASRILKGEKPADLPVQQVTKVELVINLKAANALGVTFPLTLLDRADEVIEWRDFVTLVGGAAAAWPLAARAQQAGKLRTIGFLGPNAHSAANEWVAALAQRLRDVET